MPVGGQISQIGIINIAMRATTAGLTKPLDVARGSLKSFHNSVATMGGGIGSAVGSVVSGFGAIGLAIQGVKSVVGGLVSVVSAPLQLAASMEQLQTSMEVMLGSTEKAQQVMGDLKSFAASTPFEFPSIAQAGKQLLAVGVSSDQLKSKLQVLGDISAGTGKDFGELASIYSKNLTSGIVQGEDLNQILEAGIPIYDSLAKVTGKQKDEIKKLASEGQISFADLDRAFADLAKNKYTDMMAKQSKTTLGLWSTVKDGIGAISTKIGQSIIDGFNLKGAMSGMIGWLDGMMPRIEGFLGELSSTLRGWLDKIDFSSMWDTLVAGFNWIKPIAVGFGKVFVSTFSLIWQTAVAIGSGIVKVWGAVFSAFGGAIDKSGAKSGVAGFLNWVSTAIDTVTQTVIPWINSWYGAIVKGINWAKPIITQYFNVLVAWWGYLKDAAISAVNTISGWLGVLGGAVGNVFSTLMAYMPNWNAWRDAILTGMIAVEFAFKNWYTVVEFAVNKSLLSIVSFANQTTYLFTKVIPGVLVWLADNWREILHDMWETLRVGFMNVSSNIVNIVKNIPGLISGAVSWSEVWKPLTEGAEYQLSKLPDIPPRVMGDMEKNLTGDVDRMGKALGTKWEDFREERFKSLFPDQTELPKLPEIQGFKPLEIIDGDKTQSTIDDAKSGIKDIKRELKFASLAEFGSDEARKSILANRFASSAKVVTPTAAAPAATPSTTPAPAATPTPSSDAPEDLGDVVGVLKLVKELLESLPRRIAQNLPQPETVTL